jgi:ribonuclease T1
MERLNHQLPMKSPSQRFGFLRGASALWAVLSLCACIVASPVIAKQSSETPLSTAAIGSIEKNDLPKQAQETLALIRKGGPFPFPRKDGTTFGNRERVLPKQPRGHYSEYTVITPGSRDRGARRIVCGGDQAALKDARRSTCYYTADHYASFKRIKE